MLNIGFAKAITEGGGAIQYLIQLIPNHLSQI